MCNKVLVLIVLVLMMSQVFASKPVDYIYIDASEGNASGGHVAIRFDADVYHYQYVDPGLIKLEKQAVNDFEFNYRFLENRSLYLSQLTVSDQTYSQLRDYFDSRFQIQQQHYAISTELAKERMLLQFLFGLPVKMPGLLKLSGAGLFYSEQNFNAESGLSPLGQIEANKRSGQLVLARVQQKIQKRYHKQYLKQRLQAIVRRIKQMHPTPWTGQSIKLQAGQFPKITYSFANRYLDAITEWLALKVIQQQRPLRASVYRTTDSDEFSLTASQQIALQNFSVKLQENILTLLQSSRLDKGQALLVNLGRLLVIEKSIQLQRLVVLNNVDEASATDDIYQPQYHDELLALYQNAKENLRYVKQQVSIRKQNQESIYSQLEWQSNRFLELDKAIHADVPIHLYGMKRIPDKPINLPRIFKPDWGNVQLSTQIQSLKKVTIRYQKELDKLYRYNLLQRNCVTELFETINQAVLDEPITKRFEKQISKSTKKLSTKRLGGYVSVESGSPNFIPFISNQAVQNQYKVSEQRILPSYRLQQLQKQYSQENKLSVFFRESNIFSSTLYKPNLSDSFFVFFTDAHPLLRPLYGAVNTLAGLSQGVFGLFTLPFDAGERLHSGVSGLIMSLPELAFFNMRKGSFKYVSYREMLAADETIVRNPHP